MKNPMMILQFLITKSFRGETMLLGCVLCPSDCKLQTVVLGVAGMVRGMVESHAVPPQARRSWMRSHSLPGHLQVPKIPRKAQRKVEWAIGGAQEAFVHGAT